VARDLHELDLKVAPTRHPPRAEGGHPERMAEPRIGLVPRVEPVARVDSGSGGVRSRGGAVLPTRDRGRVGCAEDAEGGARAERV
jgi:hypothetical protein